MALYHFLLCDPGGNVANIHTEESESDDDARERALRMLPRQGILAIEVWRGQLRVGRVENRWAGPTRAN